MAIYVYGSHKVADFNQWKPVFDSDESRRLASGVRLHKLFRSVNDPNDVHFIFEVDDLESFQKALQDPALPELMKQAGVLAPPVFVPLNEV